MHSVKVLADEISFIDHPIADDDLTLNILNGQGSDFRDIAAPIRVREKPLAFEELHDLLVGHDAYLRRLETTIQQLVALTNYSNRRLASSSGGQHSKGPNNSKKSNGQRKYTPNCQICDELGHIAKHCPCLRFAEPIANYVAISPTTNPKWLIDSGASHNITGDVANLSIHSEYDDTDKVVIGDDSGLLVSHVRVKMAFILSKIYWCKLLQKWLLMCMNEPQSMGGTSVLDIPLKK
ncbi:hypothetical protein AAG906_008080 [Vitis piasezkii]